jgi:hypothetical protein
LTNEIIGENLLRDSWSERDQADLRLFLQERIGRPGQYDGDENMIHLPLAREQCMQIGPITRLVDWLAGCEPP